MTARKSGIVHFPTCQQCGKDLPLRRFKFCSKKCQATARRLADPEKARAAVRKANTKRYARDGNYRKRQAMFKRTWRANRAAVIGGFAHRGAYRSDMEARVIGPWQAHGAEYEPCFLRFQVEVPRRYTPDVVLPNGIAIEVKGWFWGADRTKLLAVKAAYPDLDLRMVLATPRGWITPRRIMTQSAWCDRHGIPWAEKEIPVSWVQEPINVRSKAVLDTAPRHRRRPTRLRIPGTQLRVSEATLEALQPGQLAWPETEDEAPEGLPA